MIDINQPNITAQEPDKQLAQVRSYLYQLSQQLSWAFSTLETGGGTVQQASSDTTVSSGSKADPRETFAQLKDLIIKSADIVNAFTMQISQKLEGMYVAQSDFGIYINQVSNSINASNTRIEQLYTDNSVILSTVNTLGQETEQKFQQVDAANNSLANTLDVLGSDLENLRIQAMNTNAYIRTGLLDSKSDGTPIYGLEVGQTNIVGDEAVFAKYARFTADRLAFYDGSGVEVAYVSDYKLYITNADITGSLTISGKFKIYYSNGLTFQWIGDD